ncbi:MAG: hypothetical protein KatS3mg106_399 [Gemmataceae bacterium]|nr:MAG: hypothetical protein KatS3mg106_399 [Gemmataceae bacterium]
MFRQSFAISLRWSRRGRTNCVGRPEGLFDELLRGSRTSTGANPAENKQPPPQFAEGHGDGTVPANPFGRRDARPPAALHSADVFFQMVKVRLTQGRKHPLR